MDGKRTLVSWSKLSCRTYRKVPRSRTNPVIVQTVLKSAPNRVIRAIANATLNAPKGDVRFTSAQIRRFRAYALTSDVHCDRQLSIADKQRHLFSRGLFASQGAYQSNSVLPIAALVVPLVGSVFGSVGSTFISCVKNTQVQNESACQACVY